MTGLVIALQATVALTMAFVAAGRGYRLWCHRGDGDGLQHVRLMAFLVKMVLCLLALWQMAIWIDYSVCSQCFFGPLPVRWPWDLIVWSLVAVTSIYVWILHWRYW